MAVMGATLMPAMVEAINLPYKTAATQKILCYTEPGGQQKGWIDTGDDVEIVEVSGEWARGNYPTSSGRVTRWFKLNEIYKENTSGINLPIKVTAARKALCYTSVNGAQKGWIDSGDDVEVTQIYGEWAYGNYPTSNGRVSRWFKLAEVYTPTPNSPAPVDNRTNTTIPTVINNPIVTPVVREDRVCKLSNGWYNIVSANAPTRCVDVQSSGKTDGVNVLLFDNNNTNNQKFYLENTSDGYITLRPGHIDTHLLDAYGGYSTNGTNVHIYTRNGTNAQKWRLIDAGNGTYWIESKLRKKLNFDCAGGGTENGTNIQLWEREDVNWHKWKFVSTSAPIITAAYSTNVKGDVNNDGQVNQTDLDLLDRYLAKVIKSGIDMYNSDMNSDGQVDLTDSAQLMMKLYPEKFSKPEQKANNDIQVPFRKISPRYIVCYREINGEQRGHIDINDDVEVTEVRGEWAYGNYPTPSGRVPRWFKLNDLMSDTPPMEEKYIWPLNSYTITCINYYINGKHAATYSGYPDFQYNNAIDVSAKNGTEVKSVANGTVVVSATKALTSYGPHIIIKHDDGAYSLYAHLSEKYYDVGQYVKQGAVIGKTGYSLTSSNTKSYHLHFAITKCIPFDVFKARYNFVYQENCLKNNRKHLDDPYAQNVVNWLQNYTLNGSLLSK